MMGRYANRQHHTVVVCKVTKRRQRRATLEEVNKFQLPSPESWCHTTFSLVLQWLGRQWVTYAGKPNAMLQVFMSTLKVAETLTGVK